MGILDKAKEAISHTVGRIKDPDKDMVENLWPVGGPDDEHIPEDVPDGDLPGHTEPVQGADPELDSSDEGPFGSDEDEGDERG